MRVRGDGREPRPGDFWMPPPSPPPPPPPFLAGAAAPCERHSIDVVVFAVVSATVAAQWQQRGERELVAVG
jgi:hypothetical protein